MDTVKHHCGIMIELGLNHLKGGEHFSEVKHA